MPYNPFFTPSRRTMTIPNQGLTVADILQRFTRGQALPLARQSHDDPQGLSEDEQLELYECEDDFERMDTLIAIEEGRAFNEPPKDSSSSRRVKQAKSPDSELVERSADSTAKSPSEASKEAE